MGKDNTGMPARTARRGHADGTGIYSPRLHLVLYSIILVLTPFILVRNYLQNAIGDITRFALPVAGRDVPVVPVVALVFLAILLILLRSHLTRQRILAGLIVLVMVVIAQQMTDFYAGMPPYSLQQNWHYIAYAIFALIMYQDLARRRIPLARIILVTYFVAMLYSSFDEFFQRHMSMRVFDVSDIAKDACGALLGLIMIFSWVTEPNDLQAGCRSIRHRNLGAYLANPISVLVLLTALTSSFIFFSSLLTGPGYVGLIVLISVAGFLVFFVIFHVSQYRWGKRGLLGLLAIVLVTQGVSCVRGRDAGVIQRRPGLVVYNGIPVPFFDFMIFPNGCFRLMDKKKSFGFLDKRCLLRREADIIVVAAGTDGSGGRGFPSERESQFLYNLYTRRGTQVIRQRNPEACRTYNRLKQEGKRVLLILHNE